MEEIIEMTNELDEEFADAFTEETTEEVQEEAVTTEPTEEPQSEPEVINAKFLGQDIPLPKNSLAELSKALGMDEAAAVAMLQKGMNYDRVMQKTQKESAILDEYARLSGMTRDAFIQHLADQQKNVAIQKQMQELRQKHPVADENLLKETAETQVALQNRMRAEQMMRQQAAEQQRKQMNWVNFFKAHPDITDVKTIPQEVFDAVNMGETPENAYLKHQYTVMQNQIAQLTQKQKNIESAPPSAQSTGAAKGKDPFEEGFESAFR